MVVQASKNGDGKIEVVFKNGSGVLVSTRAYVLSPTTLPLPPSSPFHSGTSLTPSPGARLTRAKTVSKSDDKLLPSANKPDSKGWIYLGNKSTGMTEGMDWDGAGRSRATLTSTKVSPGRKDGPEANLGSCVSTKVARTVTKSSVP